MKTYAYIILVLALLGFVKWYSDTQYQAGYDAAKSEYESKLRDEQTAHINTVNETEKTINAITKLWLEKEPEKQVIYEKIKAELPVYINDDSRCNLSYGTVELFNRAGDPGRLQDNYHTTLTENEKRILTFVTKTEAIEICIEWGKKYNQLARKHDKLNEVLNTVECIN